jgi:hypothetical protein
MQLASICAPHHRCRCLLLTALGDCLPAPWSEPAVHAPGAVQVVAIRRLPQVCRIDYYAIHFALERRREMQRCAALVLAAVLLAVARPAPALGATHFHAWFTKLLTVCCCQVPTPVDSSKLRMWCICLALTAGSSAPEAVERVQHAGSPLRKLQQAKAANTPKCSAKSLAPGASGRCPVQCKATGRTMRFGNCKSCAVTDKYMSSTLQQQVYCQTCRQGYRRLELDSFHNVRLAGGAAYTKRSTLPLDLHPSMS